jgi:penicillin-binding protein 2
VNLIGEKKGLVPNKEWKLSARNEAWLPGETISASIGQGYNLVTPIQQANLLATVANGGLLMKPFLVKGIRDKEGTLVRENSPQIINKLDIKPVTLKAIQKALLGVVYEKRGTGWRARLKSIQIAGKTGTAQVVRLKNVGTESEEEEIPYVFRDHAWFVAFAPYENPEIAVAVIVEHGGHGGATAAPIARKIIETYNRYYPREVPENTEDGTETESSPNPAAKSPGGNE